MSEIDLLKERAALAAHAIAAVHPYRTACAAPGAPAADAASAATLVEHLDLILHESVKDLYAYYAFRAHQPH